MGIGAGIMRDPRIVVQLFEYSCRPMREGGLTLRASRFIGITAEKAIDVLLRLFPDFRGDMSAERGDGCQHYAEIVGVSKNGGKVWDGVDEADEVAQGSGDNRFTPARCFRCP